jgi:hypothetical protein
MECRREHGGVHQIAALVVPDQERFGDVAIRNVTADDELLPLVGPPLEPISRTFP